MRTRLDAPSTSVPSTTRFSTVPTKSAGSAPLPPGDVRVLVADCAATTSPAVCMDATLYNVQQCDGFVARSGDIALAIAIAIALEEQAR